MNDSTSTPRRRSAPPAKLGAAAGRRAPHIGALATLPVFFSLRGKDVLLAGGGDAALWKAELLAAAGARVHIYAPPRALGAAAKSALRRLLDSPQHYVWHRRGWHADAFAGVTLAVAETACDTAAGFFARAAAAAGVPANVIDRPAFCAFQFGSIVNRSPLVVGISTNGAAPVLAQAVRRRIETLLPAALADWAACAARLRAAVATRFAAASARRAFWRRFAERAFAAPPPADDGGDAGELLLRQLSRDLTTDGGGRVTLVGAGPGGAELLTLKALRALQTADVVLFDDLVSDDVLDLARREAERIRVGQLGGGDGGEQDSAMVTLAKAGRRVVRLKSDDSMMSGNAGAEIERLRAAGVTVDVVPGVTSARALVTARRCPAAAAPAR